MELMDEELTYALKGCFFDVHAQVGFGMAESAYQEALAIALASHGIPARSHPRLCLTYGKRMVHELIPDFVVAERIIVELKTLREDFARSHHIQLFSYLKAFRIRLGFLVNFGRERVVDARGLFDERPVVVNENWGPMKDRVGASEKDSLDAIRQAIMIVGNQFGLGYGDEVYRKLLTAVLEDDGHVVYQKPRAEPHYNGRSLGTFPVDCLLVDGKIPCVTMALKDGLSQFDLDRCSSYLKNLRLQFGLVLNFGKKSLDMAAVRFP